MYKCTKCGKAVIVTDGKIIRACGEECANEPITADASATVYSKSSMTHKE